MEVDKKKYSSLNSTNSTLNNTSTVDKMTNQWTWTFIRLYLLLTFSERFTILNGIISLSLFFLKEKNNNNLSCCVGLLGFFPNFVNSFVAAKIISQLLPVTVIHHYYYDDDDDIIVEKISSMSQRNFLLLCDLLISLGIKNILSYYLLL